MLRTFLVAALLVTLTPFANAHGPCAHGADPATAIGNFYVTADGHIFEETGAHAGLQRTGGTCETDDGRTGSWASDTSIL